jgi:hypothetical protein
LIFVRERNLSVYSNAVRAEYCSQSLHENYETGCGLIEKPRDSLDHLSRRHFDHSFFSRNIEPSQKNGNRLASVSGIPDKLQEVKSHSISTDCVVRDVNRFGINAVRIASNQSCANSKRMSSSIEFNHFYNSTSLSGARVLSPSDMVCPTPLPSSTNFADNSSAEVVQLQCLDNFDTNSQNRPGMVDNCPTNTAGESKHSTISRYDHLFGCFQTGVGGIQRTRGCWSERESQDHINRLELRAAFFALKSFLPSQTNRIVSLKMDNTTV